MRPSQWFLNARDAEPVSLFSDAERGSLAAAPAPERTPLHRAKGLAGRLGLKSLRLKDETSREALPAFKILGAGFAIAELQRRGRLARGATVLCASEGNHGRAMARAARERGLRSRVYVGAQVSAERAEAIALEGADIVRVEGSYDDAVRRAAADAAHEGAMVISDTSYAGYEEIPRLIMLGYTRLMDEACAQWKRKPPELVLVQGGVGGLAASVASWYAAHPEVPRARLVVVEPLGAACLLASARAGALTSVPAPHETFMGGLRCGEASPVAWPAIAAGYDAFVAIDDEWARRAMRLLARPPGDDVSLPVGTSGVAGVAALLALREEQALEGLRSALGITERTRAMALLTEGVTEPSLYAEIVGGAGTARLR